MTYVGRACAGEEPKGLVEPCGALRDREHLDIHFDGALVKIEGLYYLAI